MYITKQLPASARWQESNKTPVMMASASGSARVVRRMLELGGLVNEVTTKVRMHAVHEASKQGHLDVLMVTIISCL